MLNTFTIKFTKRHRVGRGIGSTTGKTCGRGHKGQKSRAGYSKSFLFEGGQTPLNIRLPKFGFTSLKNKFKHTLHLHNLDVLANETINLNILKTTHIIKKNIKFVKILYSKKINNIKINDKNIKLSKKTQDLLSGGGGI
ncbi:MAG TPA: 50S ribosomal protein L15 [Candidatus Azoamicus sp. OHIO2]